MTSLPRFTHPSALADRSSEGAGVERGRLRTRKPWSRTSTVSLGSPSGHSSNRVVALPYPSPATSVTSPSSALESFAPEDSPRPAEIQEHALGQRQPVEPIFRARDPWTTGSRSRSPPVTLAPRMTEDSNSGILNELGTTPGRAHSGAAASAMQTPTIATHGRPIITPGSPGHVRDGTLGVALSTSPTQNHALRDSHTEPPSRFSPYLGNPHGRLNAPSPGVSAASRFMSPGMPDSWVPVPTPVAIPLTFTVAGAQVSGPGPIPNSGNTAPIFQSEHSLWPQQDTLRAVAVLSQRLLSLGFHVLTLIVQELYLILLFHLPRLYFSRVRKVFEDAELSKPDIIRIYTTTANEWQQREQLGNRNRINLAKLRAPSWNPINGTEGTEMSPAIAAFKDSWEGFIKSLLQEWSTLNIVSALLSASIVALLSVDGTSDDPFTQTTSIISLICSLWSIVHTSVYTICFGTMSKMHKAASWAEEAQRKTSLVWNVWTLLAMPAVWLVWSLLFFMLAIMSYVWRAASVIHSESLTTDRRVSLETRIVISCVLLIGALYFFAMINTLRRYGEAMDETWKREMTKLANKAWHQQMGNRASSSRGAPGTYAASYNGPFFYDYNHSGFAPPREITPSGWTPLSAHLTSYTSPATHDSERSHNEIAPSAVSNEVVADAPRVASSSSSHTTYSPSPDRAATHSQTAQRRSALRPPARPPRRSSTGHELVVHWDRPTHSPAVPERIESWAQDLDSGGEDTPYHGAFTGFSSFRAIELWRLENPQLPLPQQLTGRGFREHKWQAFVDDLRAAWRTGFLPERYVSGHRPERNGLRVGSQEACIQICRTWTTALLHYRVRPVLCEEHTEHGWISHSVYFFDSSAVDNPMRTICELPSGIHEVILLWQETIYNELRRICTVRRVGSDSIAAFDSDWEHGTSIWRRFRRFYDSVPVGTTPVIRADASGVTKRSDTSTGFIEQSTREVSNVRAFPQTLMYLNSRASTSSLSDIISGSYSHDTENRKLNTQGRKQIQSLTEPLAWNHEPLVGGPFGQSGYVVQEAQSESEESGLHSSTQESTTISDMEILNPPGVLKAEIQNPHVQKYTGVWRPWIEPQTTSPALNTQIEQPSYDSGRESVEHDVHIASYNTLSPTRLAEQVSPVDSDVILYPFSQSQQHQ